MSLIDKAIEQLFTDSDVWHSAATKALDKGLVQSASRCLSMSSIYYFAARELKKHQSCKAIEKFTDEVVKQLNTGMYPGNREDK